MPSCDAQEDEVLAVGDGRAQQFVAVVQRERDDAARKRIVELGQFALLDHALARHHDDELPGTNSFTDRNALTLSSGCRLIKPETCLPLPVVPASGIS